MNRILNQGIFCLIAACISMSSSAQEIDTLYPYNYASGSYELIDLSSDAFSSNIRETGVTTENRSVEPKSGEPRNATQPRETPSEQQYRVQRKGKALMDAILHLYIASVRLSEVGEVEKGKILLRQAQDLGLYAEREFKIQIPVELRERLGLVSTEEYQLQQERIRLEREVEQLRQRMNHIDSRLKQIDPSKNSSR